MSEDQKTEYIVEFEGVPNSPVGLLLSSLVIGKTQGQLNLNHPDISDPHCTFILNSEILCLIDMQSEKGVYVNRVKIPTNKMIILMEGDEIHLGRVKVKVSAKVKLHNLDEVAQGTGARVIELDIDNPGKKYFENPTLVTDNLIKINQKTLDEKDEDATHEKTLSFLDKTRTSLTKITKNLFGGDSSEKEKTRMLGLADLEKEKKKEKASIASFFASKKKQAEQTDNRPTRLAIKIPTANQKAEPVEQKIDDANLGLNKKNEKKKNKHIVEDPEQVPAPISLVRLAGVFNDALLTALVGQLLSDQDMLGITEPVEGIILGLFELVRSILPDAEFVFTMLDPFVGYFALYLLLRILGNLIFGVSIGQLLVGMKAQGPALQVRISGVLRSFLEIVTKPTVLSELPVLIGKKSLKEKITKTNFTIYSSLISIVMSVVIPLGLFFFVFLLPFFELEVAPNINVRYPLTLFTSELDKTKPVVESKVLNLKKELEAPRDFLAYPAFQLHKGSAKKTYFPTFHLFHLETQKKMAFAKLKDYDSKEIFGYLFKNNPFAINRFPAIKKFIDGFPFDDEKFSEQVREVVESSFALNADNLTLHTLKHGPYYRQFFDFRRSIEATVDETFDLIDFIKVNDQLIMRLKLKSMKLDDFLLMTLGENSSIYRLSFEKSAEVDKLFEIFFKGYLKGSSFGAYQTDLSKNFDQAMNVYEAVDIYTTRASRPEQKKIAMITLYQYYATAGKVALEIKNDSLKNDVIKSIEKFLAFQKEFSKADEADIQRFTDLINSLKNNVDVINNPAPIEATP